MLDDNQETKLDVIRKLKAHFRSKTDMMEEFKSRYASKRELIEALKKGQIVYLVDLVIAPSSAVINEGDFQQFTVTGTYSDGSIVDLTTIASYTSSKPDIVTIDNKGLATGVSPGKAEITAAAEGLSTVAAIEIKAIYKLIGIAISPSALTLSPGLDGQLTVIGQYSDGTTQDITAVASYQSSAANIAAVDATGFVIARAVGAAEITAAVEQFTAAVQVQVQAIVAPPANLTVATNVQSAGEFLYTGENPIQTGVEPGTIEIKRAALIRGKVFDRNSNPLQGVQISILNHPEFGQTSSQKDGQFALAVNGGELFTLQYQKDGFLAAQRQVEVPWQDYAVMPDVVMIEYDETVSAIDLTVPGTIQVAQGSVVADQDGVRQAALLFKPGTKALMVMPDGSKIEITSLSVRATEFTVGENGPQTMPAILPPASAYTYAVEFSADEAVSAGAVGVEFNQALPFYVENFLNFPVGLAVPAGFYDYQQGQWSASPNGRVIRILSVTGSLAEIDIDGSGRAATPEELAALGIDDAERITLARMYQAGQSLWRVPITHFSPWDDNWPYGTPVMSRAPDVPPPVMSAVPVPRHTTFMSALPDPCKSNAASVIEFQSQVLGENIAVAGTPYYLHYQSDRVMGRRDANTFRIPLSVDDLPDVLKRIDLTIDIAGQHHSISFAPEPNLSYTFTWDGRDSFGRVVQGQQKAKIIISYVYDAVYLEPAESDASFNRFGGARLEGNQTRQEITLSQSWDILVGVNWDNKAQRLGGWSLNACHVYDVNAQTVLLGDGNSADGAALGNTVNTLAGNGKTGYAGDGNATADAILKSPYNMAISAAGIIYIADSSHSMIRKVGLDGIITTIAGDGFYGFDGENSQAAEAVLNIPQDVAVGQDGSIYIADTQNHRIRKIDANGIITTVAGTGEAGYAGDGGLATNARINTPFGITAGLDGSIYIADTRNHRIRKVDASGIITTIAGNGEAGYGGDGGLATLAKVNSPSGTTVGVDGSIYIADTLNHRIRKIDANGIITTTAGTGEAGYSGDGGLAVVARLNSPFSIAAGTDGSVYIADTDNSRIRKIDAGGIITTIAGNGEAGFNRDGILAVEARLAQPTGVAMVSDGSIYVADRANNRIRRIDPAGIITTAAGSGTVYFVCDQGPATEAILIRPSRLALGQDGSIYIADLYNQRIRKVGPDGIITTLAGTGEYGFNGDGGLAIGATLARPLDAAVGADGGIYIADSENHRIRKIDTDGIITTVAGTGEAGYSGDGGLAILAKLDYPSGVAAGADGSIYIADYNNCRIRRVDPSGIITTIAGNGEAGYSGDGGLATLAQLNGPVGITIEADGSIYIADYWNHRIRKVNPAGIITTIAGNGEAGYSGDGGPAINASLYCPAYTAIGSDGSIYVADELNHRIRKIDVNGIISTVAGDGEPVFFGDGGAAASAKLGYPLGVAAGTDGSIYIGDNYNNRIRRIDTSGIINTIAGTGEVQFVGDKAAAAGAFLNFLADGCVGPDGSIYFADMGNHRVRKVNPGGIITTIAGVGEDYYKGDGGLAIGAALNAPADVAIGTDGSFYIADKYNHRIRRINAEGIITTIAGTGEAGYSGDDDPGASAQLNFPSGVAVSTDGSIYIADRSNHRVRRLDTNGIITTIAGTGEAGFGGDDGPAVNAELNNPESVAIGLDGSIYIADEANNRIRRVKPDGIIITAAGNGEAGYSGDGGPAVNAALWFPADMTIGTDGSIYIADTLNNRIRWVSPDGIITTVAGTGEFGFTEDKCLANDAKFKNPAGVAVGPDGWLYVFDAYNNRVRKIALPLPGLSLTDITVASEDGLYIYLFDNLGRHVKTLNILTGESLLEFTYDASGVLQSITDGYGNVTSIERDGAGNPAAIMAPGGQRTTLAVDANGYLSAIADPAGAAYQFQYAPDGLMTTETSPRGFSSKFSYDGAGRLVKDEDAAGGSTSLELTEIEDGFTLISKTALGRTSLFEVKRLSTGEMQMTGTNPAGQKYEGIQEPNGKYTVKYANGNLAVMMPGPDNRFGMQAPVASELTLMMPSGLTSRVKTVRTTVLADPDNVLSLLSQEDKVDVNGQIYHSVFDAETLLQTATTPEGRKTFMRQNELGQLAEIQVPGLQPVNYSYDDQGRLAQIVLGVRMLRYEYNSQGYLSRIIDPLLRRSDFAYDEAGRVIEQVLPDGRIIRYSYDTDNNLLSITPPGRPPYEFSYNAVDLDREQTAPAVGTESNVTSFSYNIDRQLTGIVLPGNTAVDFNYDSTGNLSNITLPEGQIVYAYDAVTGNMIGITSPDGSQLSYEYDGSLVIRETMAGSITGSVATAYFGDFNIKSVSINGADPVDVKYDLDGNIVGAGELSISREQENALITGTLLGEVKTSQTNDEFGLLAAFTATFGTNELFTESYIRDEAGRITNVAETILGETTSHAYVYDAGGRLVETYENGILAASYIYDENNNRLKVIRLTGEEAGVYDSQDRLVTYGSAQYAYTPDGNLRSKVSGQEITLYRYDAIGNLLEVALPDGARIEYVIDGRNRRVGKKVDGVLVQGFLYQDQLSPAAELDGNNRVVSRFVYGSKQNVPDYMVKEGRTYRLISDHLGSIRLVVDAVTGNVVQRIDYDEFGRITRDTNPAFQPFGFAGGLFDADTKLVRFGARDYDAATGRWTIKDPLGFIGGQTNLYSYALMDPINIVDPNGLLFPLMLAGALIGAVVNVATYAVNAAMRDDVVITKKGLVGAAISGAIGGGVGVIATPLGAAAGLGGKLAPLGTALVNAVLGAASTVISARIDPCANLTVSNVISSAAFGALSGMIGGKLFPTKGMDTFSQIAYFCPRTWSGIIPRFLGGTAGKNAINPMWGGAVGGAIGGAGPSLDLFQ